MDKPVSTLDLQKLRERSLVSQHEIAFLAGDVLIAEHVITKERRVVEAGGLILESSKKLLRD